MKLTRRQLAAAVSAAAIAKSQTPPQSPPADELQAARDRLKANANALAQHELPMSVEPAFRFKA